MSVALVAAAPAQIARSTIAKHSKSFALASKLLDARVRDQTAVVYTWCRWVDDAVDEAPASAEVLPRLHTELTDAYAGTTPDAVLAAFGAVARERAIPRLYPDELLAGMAMDVDGVHYATHADLRQYCWRVAGVVGLMMSHVFGVRDERALIHAAHLGIAMQLTNICRDVAEDWQRERLYLPDELLAAHGVGGLAGDLGSPLPASALPGVGRAVRELLALAERYYRSGDRGVRYLPWRAALAVRAARNVYSAIGGRIARADYDVSRGRAVVPTSGKLLRVATAAARIAASAPHRAFMRPARVPTTTLELADVPEP